MARSFSSRSRDSIRAVMRRHVRYDARSLERANTVTHPEPGERVTVASLATTTDGVLHLPHCNHAHI
jgi:hypothetical protein